MNNIRQNQDTLSSTERQGIRQSISDLNEKQRSIISITNTIQQQETALDNLKAKFGNIIPDGEIEKIKSEMQGLFSSTNLKGDTNTIDQEIEKLKELGTEVERIKSMGTNLGSFSSTGLNMESSIQDVQKFIQGITNAKASISSINESVDSLGNKMKTISYNVDEGSSIISKHKMTIDGDSESVYNLNTGLQNVSSSSKSFGSSIANSIKGLIGFSAVSAGVYAGLNQIKSAIQNITDLNTAQTNIQMITGMNQQQVQGLTQQFSDLATQLHSTTGEMMSGAENFLRAGDSIDQTKSMLKATTIGATLSGQSEQDVADQLIAISNGFKMNTKDAQSMMDVVSKLTKADNDSATSFKEISTAMQGSSAMAQSVKVDFDHLLAYISTVSSVTRENASSIGESFQAQFARYQNVKGGQKFDAEGQDLSNVERDLNKYADVKIRSDSGTFKSYETVIDELSKKWGNLNEVSRAAISKAMAGTTHANDFQVLMQNYDKVKGMLKDVGDSAGYAEDKFNNVWSKQTQARTKDFQHSVEQLYQSIGNSSMINKGLGALTNVIKFLTTITTSAPKSGAALAGIATAIVLVVKNAKPINGLFTQAGIVLTNFINISSKAGLVTGLADTFSMLATSIKGVSLAFLTNPVTLIIAGLGIAAYAIIKHIQTLKQQKQAVEDTTAAYKSLNQSIKNNTVSKDDSNLQKLKKDQTDLTNAINARNKAQKELSQLGLSGNYDASKVQPLTDAIDKANKTINSTEKALDGAKVAYNKVTGAIDAVAEAENKIAMNNEISDIKKTTQAELDHRDKIISLGNAYEKLQQISVPSKTTQSEMSSIAQELSKNVAGLTTTKDKDGNVTVANTELLKAEIGILGNEGTTVQQLADVKLEAAKSNEKVQVDETTMTYTQAEARIGILKNEANFWSAMAKSAPNSATAKLFKGYSKNTGDAANEIKSQLSDIDKIYQKAMDDVKKLSSDSTDPPDWGPGTTSTTTKKSSAQTAEQKAQSAAITAQSRELANQSRNITIQSRNLDMQAQRITNQENALDAQSRKLSDESQALENKSQILDIQKSQVETKLEDQYNAEQQAQDAIIKKYQDQLDVLQQKKSVQDDNNTLLKDENDLILARQNLLNAQNQKNVRVFENGQWTWQADQSAVSNAQQSLVDTQQTVAQEKADIAEKAQEDALNAKIKSAQDTKDAQTTTYNNKKNQIDESYQKQQDNISLQKINIQNEQTNISDRKAELDQEKQNIDNEKSNLDAQKNAIDEKQNSLNDQKNAVSGYAEGTNFVPETNQYLVGENGKEIVTLPKGASVTPNDKTEKILSGNTNNNSVSNSMAQSNSTRNTLSAQGQSINGNKQLVKKPIDNMLKDINSDVTKFVNNSVKYPRNANKKMGDTVNSSEPLLEKPVKDTIKDVDTDIQNFVDGSGQYAHDTNKNIGNAVNNNKSLLKNPIDTLVKQIEDELQGFTNASGQYGKNSDINIGNAVNNNSNTVYDPIKLLIKNIKTLLNTFLNDVTVYGKAIDIHLSGGINEGKPDLLKNIDNLCDTIVAQFRKDLKINSPSKVMIPIGAGIVEGIIKGMDDSDIEKLVASKADGIVSNISPVPGNIEDWIKQALKLTNTSDSWIAPLEMIMSRETGSPGQLGTGNPTLTNPMGVNGQHATGLMQMLPSTFQSHMIPGHNNIMNPIDNLASAIEYIKATYGNPTKIKNWNNSNYIGYANGTENVPNTDIYRVNENNGDETMMLNKGSGVITSERTHNLNVLADYVPNLIDVMSGIGVVLPQLATKNFNDVNIPDKETSTVNRYEIGNISLPSVNNAQQFVDDFQRLVNVRY